MNIAQFFDKEGYYVVKGLVNTKKYHEYALKNQANGEYDTQVPGTPSFYGNKYMGKLHSTLKAKLEKLTGLKLFKTYTYYRVYKKGDVLRIHSDRPSCEISISLCLGYKAKKPWGLYVLSHNEEPIKVLLRPGDALLYKGVEMKHWRPKFTGEHQAQIFLHYVDANGPYAEWKNDKKVANV